MKEKADIRSFTPRARRRCLDQSMEGSVGGGVGEGLMMMLPITQDHQSRRRSNEEPRRQVDVIVRFGKVNVSVGSGKERKSFFPKEDRRLGLAKVILPFRSSCSEL